VIDIAGKWRRMKNSSRDENEHKVDDDQVISRKDIYRKWYVYELTGRPHD
jgi:hypothetical protein